MRQLLPQTPWAGPSHEGALSRTTVTFLVTAAAVLLFLSTVPSEAVVIFGPYLEGATTTNAYVLAECSLDASSPLTVHYGITSSYGSNATTSFVKTTGQGTTNVHRLKLTGLAPDTLYHYQLAGQGFTSPDYTFRTLLAPGNNFRFAWQADFRNGTAVHGAIDNLIRLSKPLFVLEGGDTCQYGDFAGWHNEFFIPNEKELGKWIPIYPTPGNHEGWGTLPQAYYQSPDSTGANGYYSFDCGDVHVTMANYMAAYTVGSAQYNWIQQDLQASLKPWKIFGTHAPAYTYGTSHGNDAGFVTITSNILEPNGVKVFLGGHNHFYQHNLVNGIRHLTVGAAGAPLATALSNATYTIKSIKTNCYLIADVSPTNLHMVVFNESSNILDVIDLVKPPAPTSVVALPGNFSATLNWDAVPRATNYTVYYGTSNNGPYPFKRSLTTTSSTITGLAKGTTYYFVVTASDTNGPSAVSAQVSAVPVLVERPVVDSFAINPDGTFSLGGSGTPGANYVLYSSINLGGNALWLPILTNAADPTGLLQFTDAAATNYPQRFYRVATP